MSRKVYLPLNLFILFFFASCSLFQKQDSAQHHIILNKPIRSSELRFEDESIMARFTPTQKQLYFTVWNKTQAPIRIIWDEVIFIDPEGVSRWVLNTEEDYEPTTSTAKASKAASVATGGHPLMSPTVVPVGASHTDYVRPYPSGVVEVPIFSTKNPQGSRFSMVLPIEINQKLKVYTFGFEVVD